MAMGSTERSLERRFMDFVGSSLIFSPVSPGTQKFSLNCGHHFLLSSRGLSVLFHLGNLENEALGALGIVHDLCHLNFRVKQI
ncbi:Uncharacterized protein FKW44_012948 [Caligus rogercresseyi]|uniref:Uncharacterized protein n=1 Tax=Caligus rogercresseyi TaxID=217165 RepID=A0A7T8HK26_CALRO|nr:Uncharacterized protein FKW44_012948 [Caligus rogercresseyi]